MRARVTIRGPKAELRGYVDTDNVEELARLAEAVTPLGLMIASPVSDEYDPFAPVFEIGMRDNTPDSVEEDCQAFSPRDYACTREANHRPPHAAGNGTHIVDVW